MTQLKDAVLPGKEKEDQAGFLRSAANYIRQLQVHIATESCSLGWLCLLASCGLNFGSIEGHSAPIAAREAAATWLDPMVMAGRLLISGLAPLQEALSHLQAMGAVAKLPEDAQWSIRALLMRRLPQAALPRAAAPPPAGADAALPQLLGYLLQQMSKVAHLPTAPRACKAWPCQVFLQLLTGKQQAAWPCDADNDRQQAGDCAST